MCVNYFFTPFKKHTFNKSFKMLLNPLNQEDKDFLSYLRSIAITVIVFGHVGGFWFYKPYSEFLHVFVPIFFFISGSVSIYSFERSKKLSTYYLKRYSSLIIPYIILVLISLIVFLIQNKNLPDFNFGNLLLWIQVRPSNDITPFPIGQVWFLHTLIFITLISPLYFTLIKKSKVLINTLLFFIISFSIIPLLYKNEIALNLFGNDLYKPLIHSSFYILGALYFSTKAIQTNKFKLILVGFGVTLSIILTTSLKLNIDYEYHTFPPDMLFLSGSLAAIGIALLLKRYIAAIAKQSNLVKGAFNFFHKHTMSVYLIHTFAIYLVETIGGLTEPNEKSISYGVIKLISVMVLTAILAIPFSKLSEILIQNFLMLFAKTQNSNNSEN